MRKIWDYMNIALGVLLCIIGLYNLGDTFTSFHFTYLLTGGVAIALAVMIFMKKKNIATAVLISALAGLSAIEFIYSLLNSYGSLYSSGMGIGSAFSLLLSYGPNIFVMVVAAVSLFFSINGSKKINNLLYLIALFVPAAALLLRQLFYMINAGQVMLFAFTGSFLWFIYSLLYNVTLILLLLYCNPGFCLNAKSDGMRKFISSVVPIASCGLLVAVLMDIFKAIAGNYSVWYYDYQYSQITFVDVIVVILYILVFVSESIGLASFPFLMLKARGSAMECEDSDKGESVAEEVEYNVKAETSFDSVYENRTTEASGADPIKKNGGLIRENGYIALWIHVLLAMVTLGIWQYIWIYKTTKFTNRISGVEEYNPTTKLLLCIFVPFYGIYWYYRMGQRVEKLIEMEGKNTGDTAVLSLVLGIFVPLVAMVFIQEKINENYKVLEA